MMNPIHKIALTFALAANAALASAQFSWTEILVPGPPVPHDDPRRYSLQAEALSADYVLPRQVQNHYYVTGDDFPNDQPPWRLIVGSLVYNDWVYNGGDQTVHANKDQWIDAHEKWETMFETNAWYKGSAAARTADYYVTNFYEYNLRP